MTVNGDLVQGELAVGQSSWFKFSALANTDYDVGVSGNTGQYITEGFLVEQYYVQKVDAKNKPYLELLNLQAKSASLFFPTDTEFFVLLTNNGSVDDKTSVNYSIGVSTAKPVAGEGEIEVLKVKDFKSVEYTDVELQPDVLTWVTFAGTKGDNVHLAAKDANSQVFIGRAYAGDKRTWVPVTNDKLNLLNLPETGTYTLGLSTGEDFELAQRGIVLVSSELTSGADVTLELKSAATPTFTDIALLQGAKVWVKYVGKKGDNVFVDVKNGGGAEVTVVYKNNLLTSLNGINNLQADGTYFIALQGSGAPTSYVETQVGLQLVGSQPTTSTDSVPQELTVAAGQSNIQYEKVTVTRSGSSWIRFTALANDTIQFHSIDNQGKFGNLYFSGDPATAVNNFAAAGVYYLQVQSNVNAPKAEVYVGLYR